MTLLDSPSNETPAIAAARQARRQTASLGRGRSGLFAIALSCWIAAPFPALAAGQAKGSTPAAQANSPKPDEPNPHKPDEPNKPKHCGTFRKPCTAPPVVPTPLATDDTGSSPAIPRYVRIASNLGTYANPLVLTVENNSVTSGTNVALEPFAGDAGSPNTACESPAPAGQSFGNTQIGQPNASGGATLWSALGSSIALSVDLASPAPYPVVTYPSQVTSDTDSGSTSTFQSWTYDQQAQTIGSQGASGNLYAPASGAAVVMSSASGPGSQWYAWPGYPLEAILAQPLVEYPTGDLGEQEVYDYISNVLLGGVSTSCTMGPQPMTGVRCEYLNLATDVGTYDLEAVPSCVGKTPTTKFKLCPDASTGDWQAVQAQLAREFQTASNVQDLYDHYIGFFNSVFLSEDLSLSTVAKDVGVSTDTQVSGAAIAFLRGATYTLVEAIPGAATLGNLMEAIGNTAAAANSNSTLTTTYAMTVAELDSQLNASFTETLTWNAGVFTDILSDWGKLSAVSKLILETSGPDSLSWPPSTNASVAAASAAYKLAALQILLPVKYKVLRFVGQVDDTLDGGLCAGQWAEPVPPGREVDGWPLWNKFALVDEHFDPPGAAALDDLFQNGANLHALFNGLDGWASLQVADSNRFTSDSCDIASVQFTNSSSRGMKLAVTPQPGEGVLGGNGVPLVGAGSSYSGTTSTVAVDVPRYSSTAIYGGYPASPLPLLPPGFELDVSIEDECGTILSFVLHQNHCGDLAGDDTWADTFTQAKGCQTEDYPHSYVPVVASTDNNTAGSVGITLFDYVVTPPAIVDMTDGRSVSSTFTVLDLPPEISFVAPITGVVAGTTVSVAIAGANFQPGAICDFGEGISETPCSGGASYLTTTVTVAPDAEYGLLHPRTVKVTNPDGQIATWSPFYVAAVGSPRLQSASPRFLHQGETATVILTGYNFARPISCELIFVCPFVGACPDSDAAITPSSCAIDSPTQATAEITIPSDAPTGTWTWYVYFGDKLAWGITSLNVVP